MADVAHIPPAALEESNWSQEIGEMSMQRVRQDANASGLQSLERRTWAEVTPFRAAPKTARLRLIL